MAFWTRKKVPTAVSVYADADARWRWRAVARNGKIVAASEQGYSTKYYALRKADEYGTAFGLAPATVEG